MDSSAEPGWDVDTLFPGGGNVRNGRAGGGELHHSPSKHRHTIYFNKDHYGPVFGGVAAPRSLSIEVVVVSGGTRSRGDTAGESGDGGRNRLGVTGGIGGGGRYGEISQK